MQYYKNYILKNSLKLPCYVNQIWFPETYYELIDIFTKEKEAPIIADCTNIVCRPEVEKAICLTKMPKDIDLINDSNNKFVILCNANVKSNIFVSYLLLSGIGGYENLFGMPGRLGSAIYGNSGSGDTCFSDYLTFILTIDRNGNEHCFNKEDLNFKRRYSILQEMNYVITEICFTFPKKEINKEKLEKAKVHRKNIPYSSIGGIFINWHELNPYKNKLIGLTEGGMKVSDMVNIIHNYGNGTYEDFIKLQTKIINIVKEPLISEFKIL